MRVRLLVDVEWSGKDIPQLQERIAEQPPIGVSFEPGQVIYGRLMGAEPVTVGEE
jgi:hypothetical protein